MRSCALVHRDMPSSPFGSFSEISSVCSYADADLAAVIVLLALKVLPRDGQRLRERPKHLHMWCGMNWRAARSTSRTHTFLSF